MRLFKRPGSTSWQYELSTPTGKKRYSARTPIKKEARLIAAYKQQQVDDARNFDKDPCISLGEACALYVKEQQRKSHSSYLNAKFNVRHILDGKIWTSDTPFETINSKELNRLQATKAHMANTSINHLTTALVTMKNRAESWGVRGPVFNVKKLKTTPKFRYLRDGEEELLLAVCKEQDLKDLIVMLVDTGMRISECVSVMWADINQQGILVYRGKTGNRTVLPVTARLKAMLNRRANSSLYVFPHKTKPGAHRTCSSKGIRQAANRAGLNSQEVVKKFGTFTAHSLRDTYATRLVLAGLTLYQVQVMLGHASPIQTQKYAHLATSDIGAQVLQALGT